MLTTKYLSSIFKSVSKQIVCCEINRGVHIGNVVDLVRYPLLEPDSIGYKELVAFHKQDLEARGVTTLPGLVINSALQEAVQEVEEKVNASYTMQTTHNIYLTKDDWDCKKTKDHICNKRLETKVAALSCDLLQETGPLKILFKSDSFLQFIQNILNVPSLYRNVDPIGAVFVNIYKDGYVHNWHFDESHWSTTLMLQQSNFGGEFQFTQPFRNEKNEEETYEVADKVVDNGDKSLINTLEFKPGTLSIFQGRRSLHSVTKCYGDKNRLLGVLHFSQREGVKNSEQVQQLFWGKTIQDRKYEVDPIL